ncbi:MAG: Xaa-Pro dipeptidase [Gammaproteobacteria bacterium]|nr:MAG: Xaa-Pro dipeptidase [Gammaproteobacteria bacterium]
MAISRESYCNHLQGVLSLYEKLLDKQDYSGLVIPSGSPKQQFLDDNNYPFKVNVHFKALLPVTDAPHSYIIFTPGSKPILAFYQPQDYWHLVPSDPEGVWVDSFDIKICTDKEQWQEFLPEQRKRLVWIGELQQGLDSLQIVHTNPEQLLAPIHYQRAYKTSYEVACLKEANLLAAKGHMAAKKAFYQGASELEIHLSYLDGSLQAEESLPYGNIVGLNSHGSVLHYTGLDRQRYPKENLHSFLLDAGATYHGYCADITRTWAYAEGEFHDLIEAFDKLQLQLVDELAVNKSYIELHILTHLKIAQLLKDADFIFCDAETALQTGVSSAFYPHGLGHMLGLQVHDIGGHQTSPSGDITKPPAEHPYLRLTKTLEAGFCLTMEPGMYFIDLLLDKLAQTEHAQLVNWTKVAAFKRYGGIRIEDDIIITESGCENLSRDAFAEINNGG